jgi:cell division protein FtsI (penicillin-binding protein 3)
MTISQQRRLWIIVAGLVLVTLVVCYRLVSFQIIRDEELAELGRRFQNWDVIARPDRGIIFDRNHAVLAGNGNDYQVGISPSLVTDGERIATGLVSILQMPRSEIMDKIDSEYPFELLAGRVSPETAEAIRSLPYSDEIQLDPQPRRIYPQGELMCYVLGYTDFNGLGGAGIEGYYQIELAGQEAFASVHISPLV